MRSHLPRNSVQPQVPGRAEGAGFRKSITFVAVLVAVVAMIVTTTTTPAFALTTGAQASITLNNGNVILTNHNDFNWNVDKEGALDSTTINWTVADTKSGPVPTITVNGFVSVTNTGSANATIGNIVVNLQHRCSATSKTITWGSLSVDVADATNGDGGNPVPGPFGYDLIVAAASQEGTSSCKGSDYSTPSTGIGKFTENAGSGSLSFTNADSNTVFSLVPEVSLTPGQTVNLFYQANFNASALSLTPGASLRTETIVSFGNAGGRGGSGASLAKIDIDGSGHIDCPASLTSNECWVRSVPTRTSLPLPAAITCNGAVTLSDLETPDNPAASGTATFDDLTFTTDIGGGTGTQSVSSTSVPPFNVSVGGVDGGTDGGIITNCASLSSDDVTGQIQTGIDPNTLLPIYKTFTICKGVQDTSCSDVTILGSKGPPGPPFGNFCTYLQSQWTHHPGDTTLNSGFTSHYPTGVTVGGDKTATFQTAADVENYLPAGGTNGKLTSNLLNPTSTSAGHFGGEVLALQLNVDFNPGFGNLNLCGLTSTEADFNNMTVSQVLSTANQVLGGAAISTVNPGTYNDYATLMQHLSVSFQQCHVTGFALHHLVDGPCPP